MADKPDPTVLVTVNMKSKLDFRDMRDIIATALIHYKLPPVAVPILRDELVTKSKSVIPGFDRSLLEGIARVGATFGSAKSNTSSGKLGGFVELEFDGNKRDPIILGLTCFHFVRDDKDTTTKQNKYENLVQEIASLKAASEEIAEINVHLGHVAACSGDRFFVKAGEHTKHTFSVKMDWALLDIIPERLDPKGHDNNQHDFNTEGAEDAQPTQLWINGSVGPAGGVYSGLRTYVVSMPVAVGKEDKDGWMVLAQDKWSCEHTLLSRFDHPFTMPGSTGSLVHDWDGGVAGMVTGMLQYSGIALFTYGDDLVGDIKGMTGAKGV
ncbi:hypothetical protein N7508_008025 [Penicillium antarcticum]|uniref:uncharacterized protein n=1 Tax=Penicillium antarcticum TaxID=416450 RepID=UPI0023981D80|nr:uncharacterized protein N7508_008025 [Penicillium antarcticum]KAJ5297776.1 hypothetical protein N7508_008025 [Penicillium antarcticum]